MNNSPSRHKRTIERRLEFLKSRVGNAFDAAEISALHFVMDNWGKLKLPQENILEDIELPEETIY